MSARSNGHGSDQSFARRAANNARKPVRIACRALAQLRPQRKIVLLYHSIGDAEHAVPVNTFAQQMAYLAGHAQVMGLEELLAYKSDPSCADLVCALTFDDGYANFYERAFPVLEQFRLPSLIYITTDPIGATEAQMSDGYPGLFPGERMLTWAQLRELNRRGVTIGSHLCRHKDLTRLARDEAITELENSKDAIRDQLGVRCAHFAYPFGRFNPENVAWVAQAGYGIATTVEHRAIGAGVDRLRVPRMCVAPIHGFDDFKRMLRGDLDYLFLMQKIRRSLGLPE